MSFYTLCRKLQIVMLLVSALNVPAVFAGELHDFDVRGLPSYQESDTPRSSDDTFVGRAIIIYDRDCKKCFETALAARSATEKLVASDGRWGDAFVYLDKDEEPALVRKFTDRYLARRQSVPDLLIVFVSEAEIVRRFQIECSTPVDVWSMAWLYSGIDERPTPPTDTRPLVRYPLTGGWWSVEGDWSPTREKIIGHLRDARLHSGAFEVFWLELLTHEELQSVHTDHHLELTHRGRVKWDYVNKSEPPRERRPAGEEIYPALSASGF